MDDILVCWFFIEGSLWLPAASRESTASRESIFNGHTTVDTVRVLGSVLTSQKF